MRTLGLETRHACRSILQAPGDERHRRARRSPSVLAPTRRSSRCSTRSCSVRSRCPTSIGSRWCRYTRPTDRQPARGHLAGRLPRSEATGRRLRAPRRVRVVDGQPRRPGRARERAGIFRHRPTSSRRSASSRSPGAASCRKKRPSDGIGASCSATACGSAGSRPTRRSSASRSRSTARSTRSSASRRLVSTFRWARRSGRRSRSTPMMRPIAERSTSPRSAGWRRGARSTTRKRRWPSLGERLARDHPETNREREARVYTLGDGMMDIGLMPILSMWQASAVLRVAHRLRERGQPAAGARRRTASGDGGAPGDWREPAARRARAPDRERAAGARGRAGGARGGVGQPEAHRALHAGEDREIRRRLVPAWTSTCGWSASPSCSRWRRRSCSG